MIATGVCEMKLTSEVDSWDLGQIFYQTSLKVLVGTIEGVGGYH